MRHRHSACLLAKTRQFLLAAACLIALTACGGSDGAPPEILTPTNLAVSPQTVAASVSLRTPISPANIFTPTTGDVYVRQGGVTVDTSNVSSGYIMIRYEGNAPRVVARIEKPGAEQPYDFNLTKGGQWDVFTMTRGNGRYTITVLENVQGQMFATILTTSVYVTLTNPLLPFLHPNQYVNFNADSQAVALAARLAEGAENDLDVVRRIYRYIINNIVYDKELALQITAGMITTYIPDVDRTLQLRRGICFDYAALTAAMLRAQHIPTRLEIGFVSGYLYHAWISVYTEETGWIYAIQFGEGWAIMDPTFSASGPEFGEFVGDATNYNYLFLH